MSCSSLHHMFGKDMQKAAYKEGKVQKTKEAGYIPYISSCSIIPYSAVPWYSISVPCSSSINISAGFPCPAFPSFSLFYFSHLGWLSSSSVSLPSLVCCHHVPCPYCILSL